jgi:signal transduction histidine kinase/ActR/RegA family two-component response regulator
LLAAGDVKQVLKTLRVADGRLELVAASVIHDPDDPNARGQGALMTVRFFDAKELARLSEVLMATTRLSFNKTEYSGADTYVARTSTGQDEVRAVLKDHRGQPVAVLALTLDGQLQQIGQKLTWQGMGLLALAGLVGSALLIWLLNRLILQRLQRLHSDVERITSQGPMLAADVVSQGNDELTRLSDGINRLLARVRDDATAQQDAKDRHDALQQQLMQSQKTEALGRFTRGIAHDFNNSLAAIGGWVRLADEDIEPEHASHEALQQALKSTRYASGLMQQLLTFSRQSPPKLKTLTVGGLIEESRVLLSSGLLRECDLAIAYPAQPVWVKADLTQMQQVLVNLIMNAVDAMGGQGTIELTVECVTLPSAPSPSDLVVVDALPAGAYVRLTVKDHGHGISAEHQSRVFDPFFTTKAVGRGTGLGLSVAHGIMGRHGGAISLSSAPGEGTSFYLYLPAASPPLEHAPAQVPEQTLGTKYLLFADDDQSVRQAWATLLERQGWAVTTARDGEEAWALFKRGAPRFDLVLTDLSMPKLDGVSLAKRIRATESPPPIILMSGNVSVDDAELLMRTDFVAVLHKPVDPDELFRVSAEVFERASPKAG